MSDLTTSESRRSGWRSFPLLLTAGALLASGITPALAATHTYQYFRFNATKLRANAFNEIQVSEFRFRLGATDVTSTATVTAPTGNSPAAEGPQYIKDGTVNTKWFSFARSALVFNFGAPVSVDNYSFATANDSDGRDPVSWTLEGSSDGTSWIKIDVITDHATTINRKAWLADFTIPAELPPEILTYYPTPSVVRNGQTADLDWNVSGTSDFILNPGAVDVSNEYYTTVTPPANKDTEYTLTATNSAASISKSQTIRAVAGGSVNYRYVRFTPQLVRLTTANPIQIADFLFYANTNDADPFNDVEILPAAVKVQGGLYTETAAQGPNMLKDGIPSTKWYNATKVPVIFDLGSPQSFDSYRITTGNDIPDRDPIRWVMEGSNDETTWSRIDDLSTFDFSMPTLRGEVVAVPLPGGSLPPLATLTADSVKVLLGEPLTFTWTTTDAATVTLTPQPGTVPSSGSTTLYPNASATYTLTATSPAGFSTVRTFNVTVVSSPVSTISYSNFDSEAGELSLLGFASVLNDFATIPQPGNAKRLRLTPDVTGRSGAAWFGKRLAVGAGFDTTFAFQLTKSTNERGADGLSFIVQDSPLGNGAMPDGESGLATRALNVKIDTYQNTGEPSSAFVQVRTGTTALQTVNLVGYAGISINTTTTPASLTTPYSGSTHSMRVLYVPNLLNVWFDNVQIVTNLAVDLAAAGAVNAEGKGFVGFGARTGGLSQTSDITSWTLTTTSAPSAPLAITAYSINAATGQGALTWSSTPGKTYRITASADLATFPATVASGIASAGAQTSANFSFTPSFRGFFRVEEQ